MAKVSLRVYNHEIEGMIEGGQLDESVAHCLHILKAFPMHIETYRLLGKCFLEARRYTDAADIFQRILMAVPDDFVAHVGMSIIRDDEGKLDDSIWHMERAFEDQPSNPAIQGELRRLYGRRDGVEPPKIRLSRDALANMYSQGELFNQAIAEIRAVLAEDANRPDLQVMLARAYYRAGQKVEAAEMAANLLKKYMYCMDALRILVDVLPGTARAENTQVYRQRLRMLDPYSSFVTGSAFDTAQVADAAVNLERLEYTGVAAPVAPQPNWASSLGIKLTDEKHAEPTPDWMKTGDSAEQFPVAASDSSEPAAVPPADDKPVPDWMRTVGWQESSRVNVAQEGPVDFGAEQPAEPIARADIPDWLKSLAPQELTDANAGSEPASANPPSDEGDAPDWLPGLGTVAANAIPEPSQPAASSQDKGVFPDWLKEMGDSASAGTAAAFAADAMEQPQAKEPPVPAQPAPLPKGPVARVPVKPPVSAPLPDDDTPFQPTGEAKPLKIEDDAMAWLEGLAAKQGAKEEELLTKAENRSEEMPDWLRSTDEQPAASTVSKPPSTPRETLPLEPLPPLSGDLAVQDLSSAEELPSMPEIRSREIPDWLRSAVEQPSGSSAPGPTPARRETIPEELLPHAGESVVQEPSPDEELSPLVPSAAGTAQPINSEDDTMAWLEGLASKQDAKEPAVPEGAPAPETPQGDITITSWLSKLDVEKALGKDQPAPDVPQPTTAPSDELPDWLKDLEKPAATVEASKTDEDLPDWLRQPAQPADQGAAAAPTPEPASEPEMPAWIDETVPVSELPAPTTPGEWVPVDEKPVPGSDREPVAEPVSFAVETPVQPRVPTVTGTLSRVPAEEKDAEFLAAAQAALDANQLNEAMQAYSKLIKKNRLLDEVIHDLREAIYRFPVDIIVWQTLGDAYMRANRLQDALDAYTKAEELLR